MMMPKDRDENCESYPSVRDSLVHNPFGTPAYKKMEAQRRKEEAKLAKAAAAAEKKAKKKEKKLAKDAELDAQAAKDIGM